MDLVKKATTYTNQTAIITPDGSHTYGALLRTSERIASLLLGDVTDLEEARIAFPAIPATIDTITNDNNPSPPIP